MMRTAIPSNKLYVRGFGKEEKLLSGYRLKRIYRSILACLLSLAVAFSFPVPALAGEAASDGGDWVNFFLMCNEGMSNSGGNSGNTMMVIAMNQRTGTIRMMMPTWDTFVNYEGYDYPQRLDMAYRNKGPEESMKVFTENFDIGVDMYMSLNFLNLASLIDDYGGVNVEVTRAERNALNGLVSTKKEDIQAMRDSNLLDQVLVELLAKEYYLEDFGPDTLLNGLQAVAFGWLQYDSVYNCCEREMAVVGDLFRKVGEELHHSVVFYDNSANAVPGTSDGRRVINLDEITDDDISFLRTAIRPIFDMTYNNLPEEDITSITLALARVSYLASRQGANILDQMEMKVFPLEAKNPPDTVAGAKGHLVDFEANSKAMKEYLYAEDPFTAQ